MKQRIITVLLAAAILMSLTAGCGEQSGSASKASDSVPVETTDADSATTTPDAAPVEETSEQFASDEEASASEANAADELYVYSLPLTDDPDATLSCWYVYPGFFNTYMEFPTESVYFSTLEEMTGVHIDFTVVSQETSAEGFNLMVSGGDYCDMMYNFPGLYSYGLDHAIENDIIIDLAPYMDDMPCYSYWLNSDPNIKRSATTLEGAYGAVYGIYDQPLIVYGTVIRQDWLDKVDMDVPVTYDDYHDVLTAFKNQLGSTGPMWLNYTGIPQQNLLIAGFGVAGFNAIGGMNPSMPFYVKDGTVAYGPTQQEYKDYLTMIHQWYTEGLIYSDFISGTSTQDIDDSLVNQGVVGLWFANTENCRVYSADSVGDPDFQIVGIPDAVQKEDEKVHIGADPDVVGGRGMCISTQCENVELALKWLDYGFSEEGSLLANWGVEGVGYEVDASGKRVVSENITNNPDGIPEVVMKSMLTAGMWPALLTKEREQAGYKEQEQSMVAAWENSSDGAWNYPSKAEMTSDEAVEFNNAYSDIATYVAENTLRFILGEKSLDEFDAFAQTVSDMGIGKLVAIKQTAYDRYQEK